MRFLRKYWLVIFDAGQALFHFHEDCSTLSEKDVKIRK